MSHERPESQTSSSSIRSRSMGKVVFLTAVFGVVSTLIWVLKVHPKVRADASVASAENLPVRFFPRLSFARILSPQPTAEPPLENNPDRSGENSLDSLLHSPPKTQPEGKISPDPTISSPSISANPSISIAPNSGEPISTSQTDSNPGNEDKVNVSEGWVSETSTASLNRENLKEQTITIAEELEASETVEEESEEPEVIEQPVESERNDRAIELTLTDTVILALQNNRTIKNAYLDRILDRQDLAEAEDIFNPNFTPELSLQFDRDFSGDRLTDSEVIQIGGGINWRIPTGGTFSVNLAGVGNARRDSGLFEGDRNSVDSNFEVTFRQPFLRNFGTDVNRAPIEIARLVEVSNIWSLKSTLINTITNAVRTYRELLQAQQQLNIENRALDSAKEQLERTQALIEAGRSARVDRVPNETAIANREVSVLNAQNRLQTQQLSLIQVLDIDQTLVPVAIEVPQSDRLEEKSFNEEELRQVALANNPSYQQTLLQLDREQLQLSIAQNDRLWNLDLETSFTGDISSESSDRTDFRAGIIFSREFGNLSREQAVEQSQVTIRQFENDIEEARENLEIDVRNAIRDVQDNFRQVQLARRARELSAQQLANEQRLLELGRSRIIDVVQFENDLVQAENGELNATIRYLNALTLLEQTIGITLEEWGVTIEPEMSDK